MIRRTAARAEDDLLSDLMIRSVADRELILSNIRAGDSGPGVWPRAWFDIQSEMQAVLRKHYTNTARRAAVELATRLGVSFDARAIAARAEEFASRQAWSVAKSTTKTLKRRVGSALADLGKTKLEVEYKHVLKDVFTRGRAETIAATETTRAASVGEAVLAGQVSGGSEQPLVPVWITAADERTCPVCAPLHNTLPIDLEKYGVPAGVKVNGTVSGWDALFPDGPPAHPNCRCRLSWSAPRAVKQRPMARLKQSGTSQLRLQSNPGQKMARLKQRSR